MKIACIYFHLFYLTAFSFVLVLRLILPPNYLLLPEFSEFTPVLQFSFLFFLLSLEYDIDFPLISIKKVSMNNLAFITNCNS